MLKKIIKLLKKLSNPNVFLLVTAISTAIGIIASCTYITYKGEWDTFLHYPENVYLSLKDEANRIVSTKDFESKYKLKLTHYDNDTNSLTFELSDGSLSQITVKVDNIKDENSKPTITRNVESKKERIFLNFVFLILGNLLIACVIILFLAFLVVLIVYIDLVISFVKHIIVKIREKHL